MLAELVAGEYCPEASPESPGWGRMFSWPESDPSRHQSTNPTHREFPSARSASSRQIAEQFHPEKIILFGSYAYGKPHADSDVDLLVIMPARNMIDQAVRIRRATEHRFPLDLIVRTPKYVRRRIEDGDWFVREIVIRGKVLYESTDKGVGAKGGDRLAERK